MQILCFSEDSKTRDAVMEVQKSGGYKIKLVGFEELAANPDCSAYEALIVDKKTWQRTAAILMYFGILSQIDQKPLLVIANDPKTKRLKFRNQNQRILQCSLPLKMDEFTSLINKLISVPVDA
jgi:hypothetical protein